VTQVDLQKQYAIGLDLGGTKILAALMDNNGTIMDQAEYRTPVEQGESAIWEQVKLSIDHILSENQTYKDQIRGVGVATAGVIDTKKSEIIQASNLGLRHVPIGAWIEDYFGLPVRIGNDANVAALGEWLYGAGQGFQNLVYITVSTGIGAGIISEGQLITGVGDSAGEFGHISIEMEGPLCSCGNRGCLENYASGTALARLVEQRMNAGEQSEFLQAYLPSITSKDIAQAAIAGDSLAIQAFEEIAYFLGIGVTNLIHILNPEVIIFGGGVMNAGQFLLPGIERTIKQRSIPMMGQQVFIAQSTLGSEAGIKGAAGLVFHYHKDEKMKSIS
jgi:glucokinase